MEDSDWLEILNILRDDFKGFKKIFNNYNIPESIAHRFANDLA